MEQIGQMKPKAVVIGAGSWFLWKGKANKGGYDAYRTALENLLKMWLPVCQKVRSD